MLIVLQQFEESIAQCKGSLNYIQFKLMHFWITEHLQNGSSFSGLVNYDSRRPRCERNSPPECRQIGSSIIKSANLT